MLQGFNIYEMENNQVRFRFYEELNDFLPVLKRKVSFVYEFKGTPSVKDAIESLGVPHVEVDLILVNGSSERFSYKLNNGDLISVYPVYESFDISTVSHLRPAPLRVTKFIPDVHLGKLAKYLRLLGFDTFFKDDLSDNDIVAMSVEEKRIILTRDRNLLKNGRVTHGYWIRSQKPVIQLEEVMHRFDLYDNVKPFTRCMECNSLVENVSKDEIKDFLMQKTREFYTEFRKCPGCKRIYWEGSHYGHMKKFVESLTDKNSVRKYNPVTDNQSLPR